MLFYKEYNFTTSYDKEKIREILKGIKKPSNKRIWRFEGNVDANEFTLLPVFTQTHHYAFRPEVYGTIVENTAENKIFLKLRIPFSLKILLYLMFSLNSIICLYFLFLRIHTEFVIGLPICMVIFSILILVEFHQRGNRMIQILITKLNLKEI